MLETEIVQGMKTPACLNPIKDISDNVLLDQCSCGLSGT